TNLHRRGSVGRGAPVAELAVGVAAPRESGYAGDGGSSSRRGGETEEPETGRYRCDDQDQTKPQVHLSDPTLRIFSSSAGRSGLWVKPPRRSDQRPRRWSRPQRSYSSST